MSNSTCCCWPVSYHTQRCCTSTGGILNAGTCWSSVRRVKESYLSLEMLQSMTVFLLVLTMMKGRWMMELGGGGLFACCSVCLFRCTRFLNAICCKKKKKKKMNDG